MPRVRLVSWRHRFLRPLHRGGRISPSTVRYRLGSFVLGTAGRQILHCGRRVHLTPKEMDLLLLLLANQGRALTKEEILQSLWPHSVVEEGSLTQTVSLLTVPARRLLGADASAFWVLLADPSLCRLACAGEHIRTFGQDRHLRPGARFRSHGLQRFLRAAEDPPPQVCVILLRQSRGVEPDAVGLRH